MVVFHAFWVSLVVVKVRALDASLLMKATAPKRRAAATITIISVLIRYWDMGGSSHRLGRVGGDGVRDRLDQCLHLGDEIFGLAPLSPGSPDQERGRSPEQGGLAQQRHTTGGQVLSSGRRVHGLGPLGIQIVTPKAVANPTSSTNAVGKNGLMGGGPVRGSSAGRPESDIQAALPSLSQPLVAHQFQVGRPLRLHALME
jgi:hypothetical protein